MGQTARARAQESFRLMQCLHAYDSLYGKLAKKALNV
jgi:hypothetical protein